VNELLEEIESLKAIIAGLRQQLLRIGNQEGVLKAAYLEGQMAKKQPSPPPAKLPERDINKLITEHGLTVVDGDIYAFAWAVQHASRTKQL